MCILIFNLKYNRFNFHYAYNFIENPSLFYNMIMSLKIHLIQKTTFGIMHFSPPKFKFYREL